MIIRQNKHSVILFLIQKTTEKKWEMGKKLAVADFLSFSARRSDFSLKIRAIRSSTVFGTRRRTALRGEGFAWVPDLGSFFKLREVGVSPYLRFIPSLSTLQMFESNEAVRGRLIVPKTWDRIG